MIYSFKKVKLGVVLDYKIFIMQQPLFVLKPSIVNALVPVFLKKFFYFVIIVSLLLGVEWLLEFFEVIDPSSEDFLIGLGTLSILVLFLPMFFQLLVLYNTKYFFYDTHVVSEFELVIAKRHSTPYHQVVNVTSNVSIWDRFCNAGDLTLHTAEDRLPDLVLQFLKDPNEVEKKLYLLINKQKAPLSQV